MNQIHLWHDFDGFKSFMSNTTRIRICHVEKRKYRKQNTKATLRSIIFLVIYGFTLYFFLEVSNKKDLRTCYRSQTKPNFLVPIKIYLEKLTQIRKMLKFDHQKIRIDHNPTEKIPDFIFFLVLKY